MPLQVKPIPLAIVNVAYSGNAVASIRYFGKTSKVARVIDALHVGVVAGCKPRELVELLAANHHNPTAARAFYTAVLSVKTPADAAPEVLADIDDRMEQAVRDLSKKLGVPVVGWIHHNTKTRHAHLIFPNSDGRRTLPLARKFLKEIQGFGWTTALAPGRGKGKRKALPVYTHAKNLQVRDLATLLLDSTGNVRQDQWDGLVQRGEISNFRRRQDGSVISFEFQRRRLRWNTLKGFLVEELPTLPEKGGEKEYASKSRNGGNGDPLAKESAPLPATGPATPAIPATPGPGQPTVVPTPAPAGPIAPATLGLLAQAVAPLQPGRPGPVATDQGRTPEPAPAGPDSSPDCGVARQPRRRRFAQRVQSRAEELVQPGQAEVPGPAPARPRLRRPARPTIGF